MGFSGRMRVAAWVFSDRVGYRSSCLLRLSGLGGALLVRRFLRGKTARSGAAAAFIKTGEPAEASA